MLMLFWQTSSLITYSATVSKLRRYLRCSLTSQAWARSSAFCNRVVSSPAARTASRASRSCPCRLHKQFEMSDQERRLGQSESGLEGTSIAFLCAAAQPPGTAQRISGFPNLSPSFQREKLVPFLHIDPRLHFLTNVEKETLLDFTPANMFWCWKKSQNKSFRTNPWQDTVLKASSLSLLENTHLANMQEKSRVNLRLSSPACFFQKPKTKKRKHKAKRCHCCERI